MPTIEEIKENYKRFDNYKIEQIAKNPKGLRKDVISILNEEIRIRNLDVELIRWVELETNSYEDIERILLIGKIESSICSNCKENTGLKGYEFHTIISVIFIYNHTTKEEIICDECARKKRIKSMMITFFGGWWSRSGFFATPFVLMKDLINMWYVEKISTQIMDDFIDNHTGRLRLSEKKGNLKLEEIIEEFNNSN